MTEQGEVVSTSPPPTRQSCMGKPRKSMHKDVDLPPPLVGATSLGRAPEAATASAEGLADWLEQNGVTEVRNWGEGKTKTVGEFWKELEGNEAAVELYLKPSGETVVVRSVHVLRGKVCSAASREKGIYCFNSWQQFGDGRRRKRNALLSEKLSVAELPIEKHLDAVCERAVVEEEMQRVCGASLRINEGDPPIEYREEDGCPLHVTNAIFVDHTVEVENSKSFPGLLTMYHLYTVDIVCTGLPKENFTTLEFKVLKDGSRKLKYIHTWQWLDWTTIRRYLFEGSERKETVSKGYFSSADQLDEYLMGHGLETWKWGTGPEKDVASLFEEIESEEANLELWSRHDGVSILVRELQVLRGKVCSEASMEEGNFLVNVWQQGAKKDEEKRPRNMLLSKTMRTSEVCKEGSKINDMRLDEDALQRISKRAVSELMGQVEDSSFQLGECPPPYREENGIEMKSVQFTDHSYDVAESPSFPGLLTVYHFYTVDIICDGLPATDFTTLRYENRAGADTPHLKNVYGWAWTSWSQYLNIMQKRIHTIEKQEQLSQTKLSEGRDSFLSVLKPLEASMKLLEDKSKAHDACEVLPLVSDAVSKIQGLVTEVPATQHALMDAQDLPPDLLDTLTQKTLVDEEFVARHTTRCASGLTSVQLQSVNSPRPTEAFPAPAPVMEEEQVASTEELTEARAAMRVTQAELDAATAALRESEAERARQNKKIQELEAVLFNMHKGSLAPKVPFTKDMVEATEVSKVGPPQPPPKPHDNVQPSNAPYASPTTCSLPPLKTPERMFVSRNGSDVAASATSREILTDCLTNVPDNGLGVDAFMEVHESVLQSLAADATSGTFPCEPFPSAAPRSHVVIASRTAMSTSQQGRLTPAGLHRYVEGVVGAAGVQRAAAALQDVLPQALASDARAGGSQPCSPSPGKMSPLQRRICDRKALLEDHVQRPGTAPGLR